MIVKIICSETVIVAFNLLLQRLDNVFSLRKIATATRVKKDITNTKRLQILLFSFLLFTLIQTFQAFIWAICYYLIPETASQFSSLFGAVCFSLVTFTTLGYGDISLSSEWLLLSGLKAINGIMLIGWSTAMMFSLIQNIYKKINAN